MCLKLIQCFILGLFCAVQICAEENFKITTNSNTNHVVSKSKLPLADKKLCGYQHSDDYPNSGNDAGIDEFPWLALLIYKLDDDLDEELAHNEKVFVEFGCAGSLINVRYVLTAAQCLRIRTASAVAVRLGEYNINKKTDCVKFQDFDDCSFPVEDLAFERKIIHPDYNRKTGSHDIALIRLNKTVEFTDYIRPICLPVPGTNFAEIGEQLQTTGFGREIHGGNYSKIKKKVYTKLITNEECEKAFANIPDRRRFVTDNVICTRDLSNSTSFSCEGDSGAPVMISRHTQWHVEGFTVWGSSLCGTTYPSVHLKVVKYLDWIEQNIVR